MLCKIIPRESVGLREPAFCSRITSYFLCVFAFHRSLLLFIAHLQAATPGEPDLPTDVAIFVSRTHARTRRAERPAFFLYETARILTLFDSEREKGLPS